MIEEQIAEAADALARIQLGLNKKSEDEKDDKMPAMFMQITEVFNEELMEQFRKITVNMAQKFGLKDLSPKTLARIAEKIKDEAIDGNIKSLSTLSQNKDILAVAEKETANQKRKEQQKLEESTFGEQNEPQEKEKLEQTKVEQIYKGFGKLTETNKKVLALSKQMTLENVAEIRREISNIVNSEEAKIENQKFYKDAEIVIKNGTEEQKVQTMEEVRRRKKTEKRRSMTSEERKEKRNFVNTNLFDLITLSSNSGFNKDIDYVKAEILAYIDEEVAFTDEEVLEMTEAINKTNELSKIQTILAKKMISISKENGVIIKDENAVAESLINSAKKKTQTKIKEEADRTNSLNYEEESKTIDKDLCIKYAHMSLGEKDRVRVMSLLDQIEDTAADMTYDLSILDKIKSTNRDFYYSMIRHIGLVARDTGNPILERVFSEIVEKEAKEQTIIQNKMAAINVRKKMTPEEQKEKKSFLTGVLYNFVAQNYHSEESLEKQKEELIKYLKKEQCFSEKEKLEFYEKIEGASSNKEFVDVLLDKMAELIKEKKGITLDKDFVNEVAQKKPRISKMQVAKAKAKIVLDDQIFNQYVEFEKELIKGISEDNPRDYDFDLVDLLKQRDTEIYENVKAFIKELSEKRKDDKKLKRLYDRLVTNDKSDNEIKLEWQKEEEQKNSIIKNIVADKKRKRVDMPNFSKNSTTKTSVALFDLMTQIYDEKNYTDEGLELLKSEVSDYIATDMNFSDEETAELLKEVMNSTRNVELGKILADKMVKLSEERGVPKGSLFASQITEMAKNRTRTMNLKHRDDDNSKSSVLQSRVYAKMFLDLNDRKAANKVLSYTGAAKQEEPLDLTIFDRIKETDESFYYSAMRALNVIAKNVGNAELNDKYNGLLTEELMRKGYNGLDGFGKNDIKAKIVFDEKIYNRYKNLENSIKIGSPDEVYDEELIEFLQTKEPHIYTTLMTQIQQIAETRNDVGLTKLIDKFMPKEEQNLEIGEREQQSTILTMENIDVSDIVVTHSEGIDMFDQKNKNGQTMDDTDDGRL